MTAGPVDTIERAIVEAIKGAACELASRSGPRAYSVDEVADRLGVSHSTVRRLIDDGQLRKVPNLSPTRVSATALAEYLDGKP
jgi:excisionase family DNA binding protein